MSRWLEKASQAIGHRGIEADQPFEMQCRCGRVFGGMRRASHQRVICGDCGYALFVLPKNVYPPLRVPHKNRPKRATAPSGRVISQKARELASAHGHRLRQTGSRLAAKSNRTLESFRSLPGALRASLTPLRLVLLGIVGTVVATGYGLWHWESRERAESTLRTAAENGRIALETGDFTMAAEAFESAEQSLTRLGRNDLFARGVHQSLRESVAARDLIPEPLSILLSTARQALADGRFDDWKKNFESIDRDGWIVVDARISSAYRSDEPDVIRVDYPMVIAGNRVELEFNAATSLLVSLGDESRRMILAAQIEDCQPPSPARETWMVRLRGETVFPWSGAQSLLALGFETDEETRALLARQADDLGLNE